MDSPRFTFRLATPEDHELIHRWLEQPHNRQWFHGQGLSNLLAGLEKFFVGPSRWRYWIALYGERPFDPNCYPNLG